MLNQSNYNKEKPPILYRGVKINYELLQNYEFVGKEMKPPYPPKLDEQGRKIVGDGNEYGVYMTDNDSVAREAYASVRIDDGTPLNKAITFGYEGSRTMLPSVGIVYKVNTNGLNTHIPWITSYLSGHYNNGMQGDEWIAESIPAENYSIDTVELGPDTLHESEMMDVTNIELMKTQLLKKIEQRKERLELFEKKIEEIPSNERYILESSKIKILKSIYRLNGIMDVNIDSFEPQTTSDYLKYLMAVTYSKNEEKIDFNTLGYIETLKSKLKSETSISDVIEMINNDIKNNDEKRESFIKRKEESGETYSTSGFDRKSAMYLALLKQLDLKINLKENTGNTGSVNTQRLGKETLDEMQDVILTDETQRNIEAQQKELEKTNEREEIDEDKDG